jgi:6-phosphogluconolactonase (cycloisomerase 2 family)
MNFGFEARLRRLAAPLRAVLSTVCVLGISCLAIGFLSGCKNFWAAPAGSTEIALTNSGNISVTAGASGTSTITVAPENSWTGSAQLTCAVTDSISNDANPATCSLSPTSVSITGTTSVTATLTASTVAATTSGAYQVTVTGTTTDGTTETTTVCVEVGTSSGGCSSSGSGNSGIFYILNSKSISGYSISSGALSTAISETTYSLTGATAMAMSPSGKFLYVATLNGITLYTIDTSTGALGQGSTPVFDDPLAQAIQVDPSGQWLLDASAAGTLNAYPITAAGAQDTSRQAQSVNMTGGAGAVEPGGIAISSALVAVALGSSGTQVFPFSAGGASPLGTGPTYKPYGSNGVATSVAIDPQGRLLYVGEIGAFPDSSSNSGALRVFTIGSSANLTEFTYSTPYAPAGIGVHAILPDSTGGYVYAASWQTGAVGSITGYSVTTSALTALSNPAATGTQPYGLAEDNTGSFVLAVSNTGPTFDAYSFDASSSGQLGTPITGSPATTPIAIVAAPSQ